MPSPTRSLIVPLLSLAACAAKGPPEGLETPVLPATDAPVYTRHVATSADPLVNWFAGEVPLDEVLSGAAATVALAAAEGDEIDASIARWAAYRAGWPYPISQLQIERVAEGERPASVALEEAPGRAWGLVRARTHSGDWWVALSSQLPLELAPFSREASFGDSLSLEATDLGGWTELELRALSPDRRVVEGGPLLLGASGEWVIEIRGVAPDGAARAALQIPIYVDLETPEDGPFLEALPVPADPAEAEAQARSALNELRSLESLPALPQDPMLASTAREGLRRWTEAPAADGEARVQSLGFSGGGELTCAAVTVSACLDQIWWSIEPRALLLDPSLSASGVAARLDRGRVELVIALARD